MKKKIKRVFFRPKEVYYMLEIISEWISLDFFCPDGEIRTFTNKDTKNISLLADIVLYLNDCPCKRCRDDKQFRKMLSLIRDKSKDNFYRMK